jgi:RHS repeat-associated protein
MLLNGDILVRHIERKGIVRHITPLVVGITLWIASLYLLPHHCLAQTTPPDYVWGFETAQRNGVPTRFYTGGPDGVVSMRNLSTNQSVWYHFGPSAETRLLTNASGVVTDTYEYTPYGEVRARTGTTAQPYTYAGKVGCYDHGRGLILCGARWYSPHLMRWMSRDPIGYDGGWNQYGYVGGDPINYVDPTGEAHVTNNSDRPILYKPEGAAPPSFLLARVRM